MVTGSNRKERAGERAPFARPRAAGGSTTGVGIHDEHAEMEIRLAVPPGDATEATDEGGALGASAAPGSSADRVAPAGEEDGLPTASSLMVKVKTLNRFIDETVKGLDPISALIWLTLFRFARGGIAWASQKTIAERLGLNTTTVSRHIRTLIKKQLLRVVQKGRRGGKCNTYQLGILPLEPVAKRPERSGKKPR